MNRIRDSPKKIFLLDFLHNLWTSFIMGLREGLMNMKKMRKRFIPALSIAFSLAISVPAFAQHIYIGETETVISYDEKGNKVITLIFDPAKTPDYMKPDSPNYWRKAEQAQMEQSVDVPAFPQTGQAADFTAQLEETLFQPVPPLTEAPEVGTVLAEIEYTDENGETHFTEPYYGADGQCTWYARGRFREVHGITLPYMGNAKVWADKAEAYPEVIVIRDLSEVPEQAVAVFQPTGKFKDWPGHVRFVEYVELDGEGNPQTVYYSDANGADDPEKDVYTPGYDGSVKAVDYGDFLEPYGSKLVGYILPRK